MGRGRQVLYLLGKEQGKNGSIPVRMQGGRSRGLFNRLLYLETFVSLFRLPEHSFEGYEEAETFDAEEEAPHPCRDGGGTAPTGTEHRFPPKPCRVPIPLLWPVQVFL
jgi:hypothetical protein